MFFRGVFMLLLNIFVYFQFFCTQDNLTRAIDDDDDEIIIPEIQQAAEHYCDKNTCVDLPATQLLKIRVIILIIIEKLV